MKVDLDTVLFWMDAIRQSQRPERLLEGFFRGQIESKLWLIGELEQILVRDKAIKVQIHAGWTGILATLLFQSELEIAEIELIDRDPEALKEALWINKKYEMQTRFFVREADICNFSPDPSVELHINTSCEHLSEQQSGVWWSRIPAGSLVALQSNDYFDHKEHVNCVQSIQALQEQFSFTELLFSGSKKMSRYQRFMIIGRR